MVRHRDEEFGRETFDSLKRIARGSVDFSEDVSRFIELGSQRSGELRKMKKFRFQLLHRWLVEHLEPCRVADVAGGKGLLTYLLQRSGWDAIVIDPENQTLPDKYKDIATGKRVRVLPTERVHRMNRTFEPEIGRHFDLLVGHLTQISPLFTPKKCL